MRAQALTFTCSVKAFQVPAAKASRGPSGCWLSRTATAGPLGERGVYDQGVGAALVQALGVPGGVRLTRLDVPMSPCRTVHFEATRVPRELPGFGLLVVGLTGPEVSVEVAP